MSSTTRIPKAEITGLYGYLLKRFSRKMLGEVPEAAEVMWHNRAGAHAASWGSAARSRSGTSSTPT